MVAKIREKEQRVEVEDWRKHNKGLIVKVKGFEDRDQASALVNSEIFISGESLPELPEGEFYWRDLIGMTVITNQGYNLGVVDDIMETGANDVLVVKANAKDAFGKKERLIPYVEEEVIESISIEDKQICVDWDPGF